MKNTALLWVCVFIAGVAVIGPACAQEKFPKDPITIVVPYAAGGSHDLVARALQPQLEKILGAPVIVDNKPGGGSTIACNLVKAAAADRLHPGDGFADPQHHQVHDARIERDL